MESGILGFGIRNTTQGIQNPTNGCNPEFKTVLDTLKWESAHWARNKFPLSALTGVRISGLNLEKLL